MVQEINKQVEIFGVVYHVQGALHPTGEFYGVVSNAEYSYTIDQDRTGRVVFYSRVRGNLDSEVYPTYADFIREVELLRFII